jgi:hypothetical protein
LLLSCLISHLSSRVGLPSDYAAERMGEPSEAVS